MASVGNVRPLHKNDPDPVFSQIRFEAEEALRREPELGGFLASSVLNHATLEQAVGHRLAARLSHSDFPGDIIRQNFPRSRRARSVHRRGDPRRYPRRGRPRPRLHAADRAPALFQGVSRPADARLAHALWNEGRKDFALYLQSRSSSAFQTDINPAAKIGKGIFLDHATGLVVGATAVIEDDVSILHSVTLGGTGHETRRPPPEDPPRRADRRGGENHRQYRNRPLLAHRRRLGGAQAGAAQCHGGRRAGANRRRLGLRRTGARNGSDPRGRSSWRNKDFPVIFFAPCVDGRFLASLGTELPAPDNGAGAGNGDGSWTRANCANCRNSCVNAFGAPGIKVGLDPKNVEQAVVNFGERAIGDHRRRRRGWRPVLFLRHENSGRAPGPAGISAAPVRK